MVVAVNGALSLLFIRIISSKRRVHQSTYGSAYMHTRKQCRLISRQRERWIPSFSRLFSFELARLIGCKQQHRGLQIASSTHCLAMRGPPPTTATTVTFARVHLLLLYYCMLLHPDACTKYRSWSSLPLIFRATFVFNGISWGRELFDFFFIQKEIFHKSTWEDVQSSMNELYWVLSEPHVCKFRQN